MEFDVVDTTDPKLVQTEIDLKARGKSVVLPYCAMSNGLNQMVDDVRSKAKLGQIAVLRIWAHGTPSVAGISSGTDPRLIRLHLTGISLGALSNPYQRLGDLRPYFSTTGRLELRACQTGAGEDGRKIMSQLVDLLGIEIHAPVADQPITGLDWYGPVNVMKPATKEISVTSGVPIR